MVMSGCGRLACSLLLVSDDDLISPVCMHILIHYTSYPHLYFSFNYHLAFLLFYYKPNGNSLGLDEG